MCIAKERIDELQTIIISVDKQFKDLSKTLSDYDKKQQDILHTIENTKFNACEGFILAKQLQNLRKERRNIKNELENLVDLRSNILNFKKSINKYSSHLESKIHKQNNPKYNERCKHEIKTLDQVLEENNNIKSSFDDMLKKFKSDNYMKRKHKWG